MAPTVCVCQRKAPTVATFLILAVYGNKVFMASAPRKRARLTTNPMLAPLHRPVSDLTGDAAGDQHASSSSSAAGMMPLPPRAPPHRRVHFHADVSTPSRPLDEECSAVGSKDPADDTRLPVHARHSPRSLTVMELYECLSTRSIPAPMFHTVIDVQHRYLLLKSADAIRVLPYLVGKPIPRVRRNIDVGRVEDALSILRGSDTADETEKAEGAREAAEFLLMGGHAPIG